MSLASGKFAVVNGVGSMFQWSVNDTMALQKAINSATKNGAARRNGVVAWSGSWSAHGAIPSVMPGEAFAFGGYTAPADGISGDGDCYVGNALVDSIVITWNWSSGEIVSHVVNFSSNGLLTIEQDEFVDDTDPDLPAVCGTKIQYDKGAGFVTLSNITQAVLTISAANVSAVNSSSACGTLRRPGTIDWTLNITRQETERVLLAKGDDLKLKLFVDATDHWRLDWGKVKEFTGISVDRSSGAIIQQTIPIEMNGFTAAGTGQIVLPGAEEIWWPTPVEE